VRCLSEANFDNVAGAHFLRHLLKPLPGCVSVRWDHGRCHRGDAIRAVLRRSRPLRLEALPPYAHELNPDEESGNYTRTA
jgi:transposase